MIEAGMKVRSHDFEWIDQMAPAMGERASYVEGVVEAITPPMQGCPRYKIRVTRRVLGGKEIAEHEEYVYPPLNGTLTMFGRTTSGVEEI